MRVNLAGHKGQSFVCGREGTLPLCRRILETAPSLLSSTGMVAGLGMMVVAATVAVVAEVVIVVVVVVAVVSSLSSEELDSGEGGC